MGYQAGKVAHPCTDPDCSCAQWQQLIARAARVWLGQVCFRPEVSMSPLPWQVAVADSRPGRAGRRPAGVCHPHQFIHRIWAESQGGCEGCPGHHPHQGRRPLRHAGLWKLPLPHCAGEKELRGGVAALGFVFKDAWRNQNHTYPPEPQLLRFTKGCFSLEGFTVLEAPARKEEFPLLTGLTLAQEISIGLPLAWK